MRRRSDWVEAGKREFAVDHRLLPERAAGAAVLLRDGGAQQPGLAQLAPALAVHDALLVPALEMRHELAGEKLPRLLFEHHEVFAHPGRTGNVEGFHADHRCSLPAR